MGPAPRPGAFRTGSDIAALGAQAPRDVARSRSMRRSGEASPRPPRASRHDRSRCGRSPAPAHRRCPSPHHGPVRTGTAWPPRPKPRRRARGRTARRRRARRYALRPLGGHLLDPLHGKPQSIKKGARIRALASVLLCGYVHAQTRRYADAHAHTYADISGEARARAMRNPHRRASGPAPRGRR